MIDTYDYIHSDLKDTLVKSLGSKNCPNCGAPIEAERCAYCGTVFIDFASMDADKPFYLKIKEGESLYILKVKMLSTSMHSDTITLYADNYSYVKRGDTELTIDFVVVP